MAPPQPTVLVIAGSDSSGGAGLQRDLQVLAHHGARAVTAITAVTAQSDGAMLSALLVPPELVRDQIGAALQAHPVGAVKIGMLGSRGIVEAVAEALRPLRGVSVVLDPVLATSSGAPLLDDAGREAMVRHLFPLATVLTPNLPEAAALLDEEAARDETAGARQAGRLRALGPRAVLLKGGHGGSDASVDILLSEEAGPVSLGAPRLAASMRGTGCALATVIAIWLARGRPMAEACSAAKAYVHARLLEQAPRA